MLTVRKIMVLCLALSGAGAAMAQTTQPSPTPLPYYPPGQVPAAPWSSPPPGFAPFPQDGTAQQQQVPPGTVPPPYQDDSYFVPSPGTSQFDYFDDEEEGYAPLYPGAAGDGGKREVKDSFKLVEAPAAPSCARWGSSLLGTATFTDKSSCEFELDQKIDQGNASIEDLYDKIEFFKLKKVIHGDLENREEAKKYELSFDTLRKSLKEASQKGCTCTD